MSREQPSRVFVLKLGMHEWNPQKYIKLVENTRDPVLRNYIDAELDICTKIKNPTDKTFIDVGAGYGRVVPLLSRIGKQVMAVEIDRNMLTELKQRAKKSSNVLVVEGNAENLSSLLERMELKKPVLLALQNILGTPIGNPFRILSEMIKVARDNNGEILISLFIQEGLQDHGMPMYSKIKELVGEPDLDNTDFTKGIFVSQTGYRSHWWRPEERSKVAKLVGGTKITELTTDYFYLLHSKY